MVDGHNDCGGKPVHVVSETAQKGGIPVRQNEAGNRHRKGVAYIPVMLLVQEFLEDLGSGSINLLHLFGSFLGKAIIALGRLFLFIGRFIGHLATSAVEYWGKESRSRRKFSSMEREIENSKRAVDLLSMELEAKKRLDGVREEADRIRRELGGEAGEIKTRIKTRWRA